MQDNDNIISSEKDVCEELNSFFEKSVDSFRDEENRIIVNNVTETDMNPVDKAIEKFKVHPSILSIKEKVDKEKKKISFTKSSFSEVKNEIRTLDPKKGNSNGIPTKLLKICSESTISILQNIFNNAITECNFPKELKLAIITPIFKKGNQLDKKNYRPISVLPVVSKLFERLMQNQMTEHINKFLSPYLCGYRKGYSAQQALVSLIEKWKIELDNQGYGGAVLMDLSKAFDTIDYDLLIARFYAYGFEKSSLKFVNSYLRNRFQRTKVNDCLSSWSELLRGVPQGSVLGPILFNIYLNDLFYINESTNVCNFADDTTFHACDSDLSSLLRRLEHDAPLAIEWFNSNYMKLNEDKCHLLVSGQKFESVWVKVGNSIIWESNDQKLLGIQIDRQLKFDNNVFLMCKKAGNKLSALARLSNYLNQNQ